MATIGVDWDIGMPYQVQQIVLVDASNTLTFDAPQDSAAPLILRVEQGAGIGAKTANWPNNVFWEGGVPPVLSINAGNVDVLEFISINKGTFEVPDFEYHGRAFSLGAL